jgi:hypothetical protein
MVDSLKPLTGSESHVLAFANLTISSAGEPIVTSEGTGIS